MTPAAPRITTFSPARVEALIQDEANRLKVKAALNEHLRAIEPIVSNIQKVFGDALLIIEEELNAIDRESSLLRDYLEHLADDHTELVEAGLSANTELLRQTVNRSAATIEDVLASCISHDASAELTPSKSRTCSAAPKGPPLVHPLNRPFRALVGEGDGSPASPASKSSRKAGKRVADNDAGSPAPKKVAVKPPAIVKSPQGKTEHLLSQTVVHLARDSRKHELETRRKLVKMLAGRPTVSKQEVEGIEHSFEFPPGTGTICVIRCPLCPEKRFGHNLNGFNIVNHWKQSKSPGHESMSWKGATPEDIRSCFTRKVEGADLEWSTHSNNLLGTEPIVSRTRELNTTKNLAAVGNDLLPGLLDV
ncbi:hypothetical protein F5Y15DRAFT_414442 [Xylariaceae sp. FL0016]|nr:hypothetical protein F5Y15DRAFT_414442 [Xylariaceae sp. FL0016]